MIGIADLHSHILPGIDDGSRSLEESLVMLSMEADQGVGVVAATPHFDPRRDSPEAFLDRRNAAAQALTRAMGEDIRRSSSRVRKMLSFPDGRRHRSTWAITGVIPRSDAIRLSS